MPRPSNRDRLLDAAEALFARHGVEAVSLRSVNSAAGLNVGAAHYHFGSKDALVENVLVRRMHGAMARRMELVDALEASGDVPSTTAIVETIVTPLAELIEADPEHGRDYVRVVARLYADRSPTLWGLVLGTYLRGIDRLDAMLAAANPDVPPDVLRMRRTLAMQTILQGLPFDPPPEIEPGAASGPSNPVAVLVDFVAAGISAPVTSRRS